MINNFMSQKRFLFLISFLVAFCLFFAGMRIPDFAHPYRSKPSQKAVIESQIKASQDTVNTFDDFFAVTTKPIKFRTVLPHRARFAFTFHSSDFPPLFPNSSRAPPQFLS